MNRVSDLEYEPLCPGTCLHILLAADRSHSPVNLLRELRCVFLTDEEAAALKTEANEFKKKESANVRNVLTCSYNLKEVDLTVHPDTTSRDERRRKMRDFINNYLDEKKLGQMVCRLQMLIEKDQGLKEEEYVSPEGIRKPVRTLAGVAGVYLEDFLIDVWTVASRLPNRRGEWTMSDEGGGWRSTKKASHGNRQPKVDYTAVLKVCSRSVTLPRWNKSAASGRASALSDAQTLNCRLFSLPGTDPAILPELSVTDASGTRKPLDLPASGSGRVRPLRRVIDYLLMPEGGNLFITAPGGSGKTTMLKAEVDSAGCLYIPLGRLEWQRDAGDSLDQLLRFCTGLGAGELPGSGTNPLFLLLDALDECAALRIGDRQAEFFLKLSLLCAQNSNIRLIMTSRFFPKGCPEAAQLFPYRAECLPLTRDEQIPAHLVSALSRKGLCADVSGLLGQLTGPQTEMLSNAMMLTLFTDVLIRETRDGRMPDPTRWSCESTLIEAYFFGLYADKQKPRRDPDDPDLRREFDDQMERAAMLVLIDNLRRAGMPPPEPDFCGQPDDLDDQEEHDKRMDYIAALTQSERLRRADLAGGLIRLFWDASAFRPRRDWFTSDLANDLRGGTTRSIKSLTEAASGLIDPAPCPADDENAPAGAGERMMLTFSHQLFRNYFSARAGAVIMQLVHEAFADTENVAGRDADVRTILSYATPTQFVTPFVETGRGGDTSDAEMVWEDVLLFARQLSTRGLWLTHPDVLHSLFKIAGWDGADWFSAAALQVDSADEDWALLDRRSAPFLFDNRHRLAQYEIHGCPFLHEVSMPPLGIDKWTEIRISDCPKLKRVRIMGDLPCELDYFTFVNCPSLVDVIVEGGRYVCRDGQLLDTQPVPENEYYALGDVPCFTVKARPIPTEPPALIRAIPLPGETEVRVNESVRTVRAGAFPPSGVTSIVFPEGLETLPDGVLMNCSDLKKITLPSSLKTIRPRALAGCPSLTSVVVHGNNFIWKDHQLFDGETRELIFARVNEEGEDFITLHTSVRSIRPGVINGAGVRDFHLNTQVTSLGPDALSGCTELEKVYLTASVTSIDPDAFAGCPLLRDFDIKGDNFRFENGRLIDNRTGDVVYTIPEQTTKNPG